jgi:hypothetical protein
MEELRWLPACALADLLWRRQVAATIRQAHLGRIKKHHQPGHGDREDRAERVRRSGATSRRTGRVPRLGDRASALMSFHCAL